MTLPIKADPRVWPGLRFCLYCAERPPLVKVADLADVWQCPGCCVVFLLSDRAVAAVEVAAYKWGFC